MQSKASVQTGGGVWPIQTPYLIFSSNFNFKFKISDIQFMEIIDWKILFINPSRLYVAHFWLSVPHV